MTDVALLLSGRALASARAVDNDAFALPGSCHTMLPTRMGVPDIRFSNSQPPYSSHRFAKGFVSPSEPPGWYMYPGGFSGLSCNRAPRHPDRASGARRNVKGPMDLP